MLKIRFSKVGRKHEPVYRLVLTESQNAAKSGKSLEILGSYDSRKSEKAEVKVERVQYWISKGAKLSDTAHNLLLKMGIIKGEKISVLPKKIVQAAKDKKAEADKPAPVAEVAPEVVTEPVAEITPDAKIEETVEVKEEKAEEVVETTA